MVAAVRRGLALAASSAARRQVPRGGLSHVLGVQRRILITVQGADEIVPDKEIWGLGDGVWVEMNEGIK